MLENAEAHVLSRHRDEALVASHTEGIGQGLADSSGGANDDALGICPGGLQAGEHFHCHLDLALINYREDNRIALVAIRNVREYLVQLVHLLRPEQVKEIG